MDDAALDRHHRLVRGLCRAAAWPPPAPDAFEVIETHLSSVLLAGDWALKLKKPLALDFVDFSTLARRRHFCDEELRLNRRTAAAWYVDVLPVVGTPDQPRLGGADAAADAIEWALRMRRFDPACALDHMARDGRLQRRHVDTLADAIARFHQALPASPAAYGDPATALRFARDNFAALQTVPLAGDAVAALRDWTDARFDELHPLMARRRAQGRVREGHGDLHLGNIAWLDDAPVPFDALEFDPRLRHVDVLADAAFTFMDLLDHGLQPWAWRWLSAYLEHTGDHDGLPLWRWFVVYRALVRAKVAAIRAGQPDTPATEREAALEAAQRRVALAASLAWPVAPRLVLTTGLSGSGKSTVAQMLVEALPGLRVRSDVERKRLHGLAPTVRPTGEGQATLYGRAATLRTYARLADAAREALCGGITVIVDAAFLRRDERDAMRALAASLGAPCVIVDCRAPDAVLHERLLRRAQGGGDASDADAAVLALQQRVRDPLAADEAVQAIDTDAPLPQLQRRVEALARRVLAAPGGSG